MAPRPKESGDESVPLRAVPVVTVPLSLESTNPFPMILPGRFHLCLVDQIDQTPKISRVFGQYGNAFCEIQN